MYWRRWDLKITKGWYSSLRGKKKKAKANTNLVVRQLQTKVRADCQGEEPREGCWCLRSKCQKHRHRQQAGKRKRKRDRRTAKAEQAQFVLCGMWEEERGRGEMSDDLSILRQWLEGIAYNFQATRNRKEGQTLERQDIAALGQFAWKNSLEIWQPEIYIKKSAAETVVEVSIVILDTGVLQYVTENYLNKIY